MPIERDLPGPLDEDVKKLLRDLHEKSKDPERKAEYEKYAADQKEAAIKSLMMNAEVPRMYKEKSFDNFTITRQNREAVLACKRYIASWGEASTTASIALFGNVGVGKSHLAVAVVKELISRYSVPARYANILHTFETARWSIGGDQLNPIPRMISSAFLVLDDLGSERPSTWTLEQVSHIVDYRLIEGLPMMITSNALDWGGLAGMLTMEVRGDPVSRAHMGVPIARIIDRLREAVGDPIVIRGKSWRGRKRNE